jgi:signal transduction histidine kinase
LRWYIDRQAQRSGLVIHFHTEELESRLNLLLETTCFRLTQEALTNVLRHAHAHQVWVELRQDDKELSLCIRDDGIGFDVRAVRARASQGESLGILGMEERVRLVGGQFRLTSVLPHGTEMYARFPLTPRAGAAEAGTEEGNG